MLKRYIVLLMLVVFLPITQLSAQERNNSNSGTAIDEEVEAIKRAAIEEARAAREESRVVERNRTEEESVATREEVIDEARKAWEEASRTSQEVVRAYSEAFEQAVERARTEFDDRDGYDNRGSGYFPFGFSTGSDFVFFGDSERTSWEFSRTIIEDNFKTTYEFEVGSGSGRFVLSINGDCRGGNILIEVVMPNGKNYADLSIDEYGNLNWRKTFTISDTENGDKVGTWKFKVNSSDATGYFKISAQTF